MAALQAQTKLSSSEPGVCPQDLRGAATANKTHKDPRPWHWPSPCLHTILPSSPKKRKFSLPYPCFRHNCNNTGILDFDHDRTDSRDFGKFRILEPSSVQIRLSSVSAALHTFRLPSPSSSLSRPSSSTAPCYHPMSPDDISGQLSLVLTTS